MSDLIERKWFAREVTYDRRREIGSMPTRRVEWEKKLDFDPLARIEELEAALREVLSPDTWQTWMARGIARRALEADRIEELKAGSLSKSARIEELEAALRQIRFDDYHEMSTDIAHRALGDS